MVKKNDSNRNGFILVPLLIIGTFIFLLALSALASMKNSLKAAGVQKSQESAFNIAEAGKEHALAKLRSNSIVFEANKYKNIFSNIPFGGGYYSAQCSTNVSIDTLWLFSQGVVNNQSVKIEVVCHRYDIFLSQFKAAIMSRSADSIIGNITVDGRDWDSTNLDTVGRGVYGIYSCDTSLSDTKGNAAVGGIGIEPPVKGIVPGSVQNKMDTMTFPHTPQEILGMDSTTLNTFNKSDSSIATINGIVYWNDFRFSSLVLSGYGVLVCHNSSFTATLKNVHGSFKGLIIADKIAHVNAAASILGSVITLSNSPAPNVFGSGNPKIRYSSQILKSLEKLLLFNPIKVDALSWKEY